MGVLGNIAEDFFDSVIGIVDDIITVIGDVVTSIVDVVADIIEGVVESVGDAISDVIDWACENPALAALIVVALIFVIGPAVATAFADVAALASGQLGVGLTAWDIIQVGVYSFIETLAASWSSFAAAIHFTTLMSIHSVGMLVSADYRQIVTNIFFEISQVSGALGFSADFMSIMLMNTRNVVLDATTTLGMGYDLSEIQWITEMNKFLKRVAYYANEYKNNPYGLMTDLQDLVQKPYVDTKASYMQKLFLALDTTIKSLAAHAENVDKTLKSTEKWLIDLYQMGDVKWAGELGKRIGILEEHISTKIFVPLRLLENAFTNLKADREKQKRELGQLQYRLAYPGDYLSEINNMPDWERITQEDKISDIASRPYKRHAAQTTSVTQTEKTAHLGILAILDTVIPPVQWDVPELATPIRPAEVKAVPRKTWFVGDY